MTSKPPKVLVTRRIYGADRKSYILLWDDRYWHASAFEFELIQKGATPAELDMSAWDDPEEQD